MAENDDSVWRKILAMVRGMGKAHVKIGVFGDATKAAAHEFGAPGAGIPERSFIRLTFTHKQAELQKLLGALAKKVLTSKGEFTEKEALEVLGLWGATECKKTISEGPQEEWPELNKAYEAKKLAAGKTTMLVDTGELINSITYQVSK